MRERDLTEVGAAVLTVSIGRYQHDALAEAYRRHGGAVYGLARRLLRNDALAEEVTREVFTRQWDRPARAEVVSAGVFGPDPDVAPFHVDGEVAVFAATEEVAGRVAVSSNSPLAVWQRDP